MIEETNGGREDRERTAERLKERIYVTFTSLAVVLAMQSHAAELTPSEAATTLLITISGTLLAVFTADFLSHTLVHSSVPSATELRHMLVVVAGAFGVVIAPLVLFGLAALDVMDIGRALVISSYALVATLGVIGYRAVRRVKLPFWLKVTLLGVEVLLGLAVIALELLAHG